MEPNLKENTDRLVKEWADLPNKNKELHDLVLDICDFCSKEFKKDVTITMIYRTDAEQDSIYKDDPKYKVRKFKSPHQFWQAVDIRSRTLNTYSTEEIEKLVNYINNKYNSTNDYNWTAKDHDIGLGDHFHIQYSKK